MFKRVSGTKDILPEEAVLWQRLEEISRNIFALYNFKEIRPPLIEESALFNRSLGENTEIVQKQMFLINNKEETYALRPEGTASIVRAYLENNLDKTSGFAKFYYLGPMFRLERPQKGRLRQFHHIGCEAIGSLDANLDVEIISLADHLLRNFSIDGYKIKINSLGCAEDKKRLTDSLRKLLKTRLEKLCPECKNRFTRNPLRILDCKNDACKEVIKELDISSAYLCNDCKIHFDKVKAGLDALKIEYETSPCLVRGLDYYTGTVFEISHQELGAQDAIGAGGRYNNLVKELGGPQTGAMGFAFGVERLLLALGAGGKAQAKDLTYLVTLGEAARKEGLKLLNELRKAGVPCDTDYEAKSIKGSMRRANDLHARRVLIIGDNEIEKGVVTLKDMTSGEQSEVKTENLIGHLPGVHRVC
ncbi:MAG: histidine--tRNA ligase [Candidatus Omnitrophota bacterium]|nr:histidine--tRNA ligase [Candidatus Omnitrophota bacterium]